MRTLLFITLLLTAAPLNRLNAQYQLRQFFKKINTLDRPLVSYDYNIRLVNQKTGKTEDSIRGRILKNGNDYIDSSNIGFVAVTGRYYCKLVYDQRKATIYDIELIGSKLNLKIDRAAGNAFIVPDSIIVKYGVLAVDTTRLNYEYKWQMKTPPFSAFSVTIQRGTLKIVKVVLETIEEAEDGPGYKKVCTISNISNSFPASIFDLNRVYTIQGDKVSLKGKFANYNLKALIN